MDEFQQFDGVRAVDIPEVMRRTTLGRTSVHKLIREGRLRVVRIGRRTLVPIEALDELLRSER